MKITGRGFDSLLCHSVRRARTVEGEEKQLSIYDDFSAMIPEDKREAFKGAVDGLVKIDSREVAEKIAGDNPHFKSVIDAAISRAVASHDDKFKAEKLPTLVEDEIKKRAPKPKDPELAALYEQVNALKADKEKADKELFRSNQLAKVLPKITELGLPAELADRLIGNDDADTDAIVDKFYKAVAKSREDHATKILRERFGNQATPTMGAAKPSTIESLKSQYNDLMAKKQFQQAILVSDQIKKMEKPNG